ncbi:hypothetical protein Ate02nite_05810 [Paractinoplanes tereljensis]|uniref:Membrane-associated oxidoreductase n=1 Tax=Paractinoplanes tereljensis TaxID=571912 RepID=A0A919NFV6_9ACTN|nr:hypothetical protein Ate02nite_05810 [Actinoplanes tereljensis]
MDGLAVQKLRSYRSFVRQALQASRRGRVLDCRKRRVPADDVRRSCLAAGRGAAGPLGLRLSNATVVGSADLRALRIPVPLSFVNCIFTDPLLLEDADLHSLEISDGRLPGELTGPPEAASFLPGLRADGVRVAHDLVLTGTTIRADLHTPASRIRTAAVWLVDAEIGGRLLAAGTRILSAEGQALQCSRARIQGEVRLVNGFEAVGTVRFLAARLAGYLDLSGAQLQCDQGAALDLNEAEIGGSVFLLDAVPSRARAAVRGRIEMGRTVVRGQLLIRNSDLEPSAPERNPETSLSELTSARPALLAPHLVIHGRCAIQGATFIEGGVVLQGAELRSGALFGGVTIRNPGEIALDLTNATLAADLQLAGASIQGTVRLPNARVAGAVTLSGGDLRDPADRTNIDAAGLRAEGDLDLRQTYAAGRLDFRGAMISGFTHAEGAVLVNADGETLSLRRAQVGGDVRLCDGFRSTGTVVLAHAVIAGQLNCDGAVLTWQPPTPDKDETPDQPGLALDAESATISGGIRLGWIVPNGGVDLSQATTTYLADRPTTDWPTHTRLGGFRYERFAHVPDARTRILWLAGLRPHDPRSWEQAASVLRAGGDHAGADEILIAQRRYARKIRALPQTTMQRTADIIQDVTVRYGFRPQRALALLLLLIALVTASLSIPAAVSTMRATDQDAVVFATSGVAGRPSPEDRCGGGRVRCFNPFFYAVDTVVPIIDLKQRATWYPSSDRGGSYLEWWLNVCTILGWIASTIFALSFTRLGRT